MKEAVLTILLCLGWAFASWFVIFEIDISYKALQMFCWIGYIALIYISSRFIVHNLMSKDRKDDVND